MASEKSQLLLQLKDKHDWYKDVLQELDSPCIAKGHWPKHKPSPRGGRGLVLSQIFIGLTVLGPGRSPRG
jgi:hypothetical protein